MRTTPTRSFTMLNRNEYAMNREDDFAQTTAVRNFVEGKVMSETEMFRLGISPDEPYRTITFTDDPEELEALASQSTKTYYWVAYADGHVIAKEPASRGSYGRVQDALGGYVATQRIIHQREPEGVTMDRVNGSHFNDLPPVPMSTSCGSVMEDATLDRLPREIKWLDDINEIIIPTDDDDYIAVPAVWFESEDELPLPYIEGISEAAAMGFRSFTPAPTCD